MMGLRVNGNSKLMGKSVKEFCENCDGFKVGIVAVSRKKQTTIPWGDFIFEDSVDRMSYQTIYANPEEAKSIAAPTAGLHFEDQMFYLIKKKYKLETSKKVTVMKIVK